MFSVSQNPQKKEQHRHTHYHKNALTYCVYAYHLIIVIRDSTSKKSKMQEVQYILTYIYCFSNFYSCYFLFVQNYITILVDKAPVIN